MQPEFHSQFGEDKWCYENLFLPECGFFVEVGAYDGIASSNTLFLEQQGWNGVLVEADPEMACRTIVNRSSPVCCAAAGRQSGNGYFYINDQDRGRSSLTFPGRAIPVRIRAIRELLYPFRNPLIDLISIDTEGTELDVWEGLWPYRPNIVIIEYLTWGAPPRDREILKRLEQDGYHEVHRTEANLILTCQTGLERNPKQA